MGPTKRTALAVTVRVYRGLLWLYPASFRVEFGSDLVSACRERWQIEVARRPRGAFRRVWWILLVDLARSLPREHWAARFAGSVGLPSGRPPSYTRRLAQDVRHAARGLRTSSGFTVLAILTLGAGIGVSVAVFTVAHTLILRPFPFPGGDRGVYIFAPTLQAFEEWRARARTFDAMELYAGVETTITGGSEPVPAIRLYLSKDFMSVLGVEMVVGRPFDAQDIEQPVAILSEGLWQSHFAGTREVLGRTIRLDGQPYTVVGVQADAFHLAGAWNPQVWTPLADGALDRWNGTLFVVGRLAPGVSPEEAEEELRSFDIGDATRPESVDVLRPRELLGGNLELGLGVLSVAVAFVLLIACTNVINMLLVRGIRRQREIAVRMVLGAGRRGVIRLLLIETVMMCALASVLAVGIAAVILRAVVALQPAGLDQLGYVGLNSVSLVVASVGALIAAAMAGPVCGLRVTEMTVGETLRASGRDGAGGVHQQLMRQGLVAAQTALAVTLCLGAGLLLHNFYRLQHVDSGLDVARLASFRVMLPAERYPDRSRNEALARQLVDAIRALPGVEGVVAASGMPPHQTFGRNVAVAEDVASGRQGSTRTSTISVSPGYFGLVGTPIIRGRAFSEADGQSGELEVAVVSQSFAERYWSIDDAVGKRFRWSADGPAIAIIGVARDLELPWRTPGWTMVYRFQDSLTVPISGMHMVFLVIRTSEDYETLIPSMHRALWALDPELPVSDAGPLDAFMAKGIARDRFVTTLLGAFAAFAALLAFGGVYGVTALTVRQRHQEIGIRLALGARSQRVVGGVFARGMRPVLLGTGLGLVSAWVLRRYLDQMLTYVTVNDVPTWSGVVLALVFAGALACYLQARRASSADPIVALRAE